MQIALVTDGVYPYVVGGMQKHSWFLTRHLLKNNFNVHVYHFRNYNLKKTISEVFPDNNGKLSVTEIPFPEAGKLPFHYIRESKEYSAQVYEAYKKDTPADFIICKGLTGWAFVHAKVKGEKLPPVAVNFHGYEMFQKAFTFKDKLIQRVFSKPVSFVSKNADYVFSYGGGITDLLTTRLTIPAERILEYPAGVEQEALAAAAGPCAAKKRFVFIGRNERRKGLPELHTTLKALLRERPGTWTFDFVGEVPASMKIKAENIRYHGLMTDFSGIKSILQGADVLVCPSWSEGMPNVILEAMTEGLAVLATDTGATRLLVNNETGWLISNPEQLHLKKAFCEILDSPAELVFQKKKNALRLVRDKFLWDKIGSDLCTRIRTLIKK